MAFTAPNWLQAPSDGRNDLCEGIPLPPHNIDYEGLEPVVEWLKAHSDSRNDRFEGTPLLHNDTGYAGSDRVADWLQASSDRRNEDDELANNVDFTKEIPPDAACTAVTITGPLAAADSAASPRRRFPRNNNLDPNGRAICTHEGCGKTFGCITSLHRHKEKHNPHWLHCEQCNYSTYRRDMLQSHQDSRHKQNPDRLQCQQCNYETCRKDNLRKHQKRSHRSQHVTYFIK